MPKSTFAAVQTNEFDYNLPEELIAQFPAHERDASRLLLLDRASSRVSHHRFADIPMFLRADDLLVLNNSRVIPARLRGRNVRTGGEFEILLLEQVHPNVWWSMLRPGKRARLGTSILIAGPCGKPTSIRAEIRKTNAEGHRLLYFSGTDNVMDALELIGEVPLPPYIRRPSPNRDPLDRERYQTIYSERAGSVAAPTAGLHFTEHLLERIRAAGVEIQSVTLHVGPGTFAPVKAKAIRDHVMHEEQYEISNVAAEAITHAKNQRRRLIAVGTTTLRVLESVAAMHNGRIVPGLGRTRIFIHPPHEFQIVNALLTNFHLPRSTLLMLASAFAAPGQTSGRDVILAAYEEAVRNKYRFFSYGDSMLLI